jgi:hypothetical protein
MIDNHVTSNTDQLCSAIAAVKITSQNEHEILRDAIREHGETIWHEVNKILDNKHMLKIWLASKLGPHTTLALPHHHLWPLILKPTSRTSQEVIDELTYMLEQDNEEHALEKNVPGANTAFNNIELLPNIINNTKAGIIKELEDESSDILSKSINSYPLLYTAATTILGSLGRDSSQQTYTVLDYNITEDIKNLQPHGKLLFCLYGEVMIVCNRGDTPLAIHRFRMCSGSILAMFDDRSINGSTIEMYAAMTPCRIVAITMN